MRYALWILLLVTGILLALRSLLGPFSLGVRVDSPMNVEAILGLSVVLVLVSRTGSSAEFGNVSTFRSSVGSWMKILSLLVLIAVAYRHAVDIFFLSDDFELLEIGHAPSALGFRAVFAADPGYGFYRPIAKLSLALDSLWAGYDPVAWHASNLLLHAANSILVFLLASRLCASPLAAYFAAALFSIHGTRPEAVVWIAGRFDLLATFFVLSGLALFQRARRRSTPGGPLFLVLSLVCMVLGILSKESAYVFPVLLVLILAWEGHALRGRFRATGPFFLVAAALFLHRLVLFGGIGGYRAIDGGQARALMFDLVPALKALVLRMWAVLFFPINWSVKPGALSAVLLLASVLVFGWLAANRTDRRRLSFALGFTLVSALPPLHMMLIGADLEKSRLLYLPSVGFCLMLALAVEELRGRRSWIAAGIVLAFNLIALQHNLKAWEYASEKAQSACAAAAGCAGTSTKKIMVSGMPVILRGVYFFGNGFQRCVEMKLGSASPRVELHKGGVTVADETIRLLLWDPSIDGLRCATAR